MKQLKALSQIATLVLFSTLTACAPGFQSKQLSGEEVLKSEIEVSEQYGDKANPLDERNFDGQAYLAMYPDVQQAIDQGEFATAYDHFMRVGKDQGRYAHLPVGILQACHPELSAEENLRDLFLSHPDSFSFSCESGELFFLPNLIARLQNILRQMHQDGRISKEEVARLERLTNIALSNMTKASLKLKQKAETLARNTDLANATREAALIALEQQTALTETAEALKEAAELARDRAQEAKEVAEAVKAEAIEEKEVAMANALEKTLAAEKAEAALAEVIAKKSLVDVELAKALQTTRDLAAKLNSLQATISAQNQIITDLKRKIEELQAQLAGRPSPTPTPVPSLPVPATYSLKVADASALESNGAVYISIAADRVVQEDIKFQIKIVSLSALSGRDYVDPGILTVKIAPGSNGTVVKVMLINDAIDTGTKHFGVQLLNPSGNVVLSDPAAIVRLLDDDAR